MEIAPDLCMLPATISRPALHLHAPDACFKLALKPQSLQHDQVKRSRKALNLFCVHPAIGAPAAGCGGCGWAAALEGPRCACTSDHGHMDVWQGEHRACMYACRCDVCANACMHLSMGCILCFVHAAGLHAFLPEESPASHHSRPTCKVAIRLAYCTCDRYQR